MKFSNLALLSALAVSLACVPAYAKDKVTTPVSEDTPPPITEQSETPLAVDDSTTPPAPPADETTGATDTRANLQGVLIGLNDQTLDTLKESFADDLPALQTQLDAVLDATESGPLEDSLEAFGKVILDKRVADVANVASATDETLRPLYSNISAFLTKVLDEEGYEICGQFAITGTQALWDNDLALKYASELDTTSSLFLAAIASGRDAPVTREAAGDAEYGAVFAKMVADGAPASQIDVIAGVDGNNPELCPSLANMMAALGSLEGEQGERSRATFARELQGY